MGKSIVSEKEEMRRDMLARLKNQPAADKIEKSKKIKELVLQGPFLKKADTILFYASTSWEVDTSGLIKECLALGKKAGLPAAEPAETKLIPVEIHGLEELIRNPLGFREPAQDENKIIPFDKLDVVIVPGLAFDKWGNRLGRGKGYYDRFLARLPAKTVKVGLAFDFQIVEQVPAVEGRDRAVDLVISG